VSDRPTPTAERLTACERLKKIAKKIQSRSYVVCGQKSSPSRRLQIQRMIHHKCECKEGRDRQMTVEGQKAFLQSTMVAAAVSKLGKCQSFACIHHLKRVSLNC